MCLRDLNNHTTYEVTTPAALENRLKFPRGDCWRAAPAPEAPRTDEDPTEDGCRSSPYLSCEPPATQVHRPLPLLGLHPRRRPHAPQLPARHGHPRGRVEPP